ncbi:MAG: hypothetical protein A2504_12545 [Bdellovibrionales bacterium RIFOXYD12_FULL_39_22]|nr:MAG: hypothetical protein A2385_00115 [Bdellovibrionales bacterium RIFOXYB1_FULL_39_21]OFZ44060.1 MAG: hypothetical protein A2485_03780 [Bdellovibrionales bacterium RIFOXYC12_FULL_39_17]OFZ48538.1 MAG: hypothetical protein A2404_07290 [Bdellovibrionales bacterium RIFOXYC1_FULL_39_130]OFZ76726.1 MAG: hypothetical protein A2560_11665 [Bdellovibrionales bacterium RIFOXYD1_FULL_39_84]OFZ95004.1 MAG: hypothetical protein A2504_12545 [Bdellovibrionales bacterium RIFOXYD12_FULL_39_22]HLE11187.1 hy
MARLFLALVCIIFFSSIVYASDYRDILASAEKGQLLQEIDNICGDTWCEGDFDYEFYSINCVRSEGICYFDFAYLWRVYDGSSVEGKVTKLPKRCVLNGFFSKNDLIKLENIGGSQYLTYTDKVYEAISGCIDSFIDEAYTKLDL